jgi:hypothetical protein
MSEDQNIPAEEPAEDGQQSTGENPPSFTESQPPTNYQLQTEKMEVHHPHHVTHKKKWTEYLLEFFMLFLAVFCGFIAENIREHAVEERREKQYMRSLVQDLQSDTTNMTETLQLGANMFNKLDTFINALNSERPDTNVQLLYRMAIQSGRIVASPFEDRTSSQLKSSGSMRLIKSDDLSDSIRSYWELVKVEDEISSRMVDIQEKITDVGIHIFHNKYFIKRDPASRLGFGVMVSPGAKLLTTDNNLLAQMSNRLSGRRNVLNNYLFNLQEARYLAIRLISLIQKEYHLE